MMAKAIHEALHPTVMVAMGVAQDKSVQPGGIDVEQIEVAVENFRGVAEIEKVLRRCALGDGFEMERQPPFAGKRGHQPSRDLPDMFDLDEGMGDGRQKAFIDGIHDDPDRKLVDHGSLYVCLVFQYRTHLL